MEKGSREGMRGIESKKEGIGCKMRNSERIREEWRGNRVEKGKRKGIRGEGVKNEE